jgi:hypothetical protein
MELILDLDLMECWVSWEAAGGNGSCVVSGISWIWSVGCGVARRIDVLVRGLALEAENGESELKMFGVRSYGFWGWRGDCFCAGRGGVMYVGSRIGGGVWILA